MTRVLFSYRQPGINGLRAPSGSIRLAPTRRREQGEHVVLPNVFLATLEDGQVIVDLEPTGDGWAWSMRESVGGGSDGLYFTIPTDLGKVLNFTDLEMVDPDTLDPVADPVAAWWAELDHTVTGGEVQGDSLVLSRRGGETFNAGDVRGAQGTSVTDATQPEAGMLVLELSDGTATTPVTLPPGPAPTVAWDGPKLIVNGRSSPDLTGPAATSSVRYDTSAGDAVYVSDGAMERLLSYDSGWRDIGDLLSPGLSKSSSLGSALIRRENNSVTVMLKVDVKSGPITQLLPDVPYGFRGGPTFRYDNSVFTANSTGAGASSLEPTHVGVIYPSSTAATLQTGSSTPLPNPGTVAWTVTYATMDGLPATLPGKPA